MRAAEFIRTLIDVVKFLDDGETAPENAEKTPMEKPGTMVPPLQRKIELMNKMADVPSSSKKTNFIAAEEDEPWEG